MKNKSIFLAAVIPFAVGLLYKVLYSYVAAAREYMYLFGLIYIGVWIFIGMQSYERYGTAVIVYLKNLLLPAVFWLCALDPLGVLQSEKLSAVSTVLKVYFEPILALAERGNIIGMLMSYIKHGTLACPGAPSYTIAMIRVAILIILAFAVGYTPSKEKRMFR